jgi:hypothetical protein
MQSIDATLQRLSYTYPVCVPDAARNFASNFACIGGANQRLASKVKTDL